MNQILHYIFFFRGRASDFPSSLSPCVYVWCTHQGTFSPGDQNNSRDANNNKYNIRGDNNNNNHEEDTNNRNNNNSRGAGANNDNPCPCVWWTVWPSGFLVSTNAGWTGAAIAVNSEPVPKNASKRGRLAWPDLPIQRVATIRPTTSFTCSSRPCRIWSLWWNIGQKCI